MIKKYWPSIATTLAFILVAARDAIGDDAFDRTDRYVVATAGVTAILTYVVPNLSVGSARYAKPVLNAVMAGLSFFMMAQSAGGISSAEWFDSIVVIFAAAGVVLIPGPTWQPRVVDAEPVRR
jgi:hypothetical protein